MSSLVSGAQPYYQAYREIHHAPKKVTLKDLLDRAVKYSEGDNDSYYYIAKVLKDDRFKNGPKTFIKAWAKEFFDEIFVMDMERDALEFFLIQPEFKINLEEELCY